MLPIQGLERYFKILNGERLARYLLAKRTSSLSAKIKNANEILRNCHFCERRCGVNRLEYETGYCGVKAVSRYASEFLHYGEEPELVPSHTIFFTGCTFSCVYCQNWDISTAPTSGTLVLPEKMAEVIGARKHQSARNVNFVGGEPTPHLHTILQIMDKCDVNTPMIWNSNMYCSKEAMKLLGGVIDIYLADFRYGNDECAKKYSNVNNYWNITARNFLLAHKDAEVIVRHLVLPAHLECCTKPIVRWIAKHMPNVRFNLMFQYTPHYKAEQYPEINRRLSYNEKKRALEIVEEAGLKNLV